jgi:hypothetical protein
MKTFAKTITLTAAQVNALDTTPVNVIPAPKAGLAIVPHSLIVAKTSGTAVGSCADEPIGLVYTGTASLLNSLDEPEFSTNSSAILSMGATKETYISVVGKASATSQVIPAKGVDISAPGADVKGFNGTLQVTVLFHLVSIG